MKFNVDAICNLQVLGPDAMVGFRQVLDFIQNDPDITDLRWAAYMLATVKWECANRWHPIEEFHKGEGRAYGVPITVTDATTGVQHTNVYYGRGYVQLTWQRNYANLGAKLGLGNMLELNPEKALEPDIAYKIMSYGMRNGSFTGAKLSTYIHNDYCDYYNARRIINGTDMATRIAMFAQIFEDQLTHTQLSDTSEGAF